MIRRVSLAAFALLATFLDAQPQSAAAKFRALVTTAQQYIEKQQWDEARRLLKMMDADCQAAGNPDTCRPLVDYSLGYLNQHEAATTGPEQRETLLAGAQLSYQKVLRREPTNGATLNNLALVQQALWLDSRDTEKRKILSESVIGNWTSAIYADELRAPQYALGLGDFLVTQKRQAVALGYFQQAAQKAPEQETPRRRILENSEYLSLADLTTSCEAWETSFPELASRCYERLIARLNAQAGAASQQTNEDALLRWTSLLARHDWITVDRLSVLPDGWMPQAVSDLRAYVVDPLGDPRRWGWWWAQSYRAAFSAEVATAVGRQLLLDPEGGPGKAARCWEGMFNARPFLAEEVGRSESGQRPTAQGGGVAAVLHLNQELASLYYRNPELDPQGTKLSRMVRELFEGKASFILERNWKATQSFHTTLALLYVERGVWDERKTGAASAVYQLRAAIEDAGNRQKDPRELFFQPLPELKALLAKGYVQAGARNRDAIRMYIEAAKAYLDTDSVEAAQQMLDALPKLGPQGIVPPQIIRILSARRNPAGLSAAGLTAEKTPWLFSPSSDIVPSDFLARQRFKLLADLAASSTRTSDSEQLDAALRAYQLVVEQHTTLIGTADLLRWQKTEARLLASVNAPATAWRAPYVAAAGPAPSTAVRLTLDGETHPVEVLLDTQTQLATKLVGMLGPAEILAARPFLQLKLGKVVFTSGQRTGNAALVLEKIRTDPTFQVVIQP
jgi:hypothetical protein